MINIKRKGSRKTKRDGKSITIDSYELSPFKILMIGGTGTGKTSLLACMHEEFVSGNVGAHLAFAPDKETDKGKTLDALNKQLQRLNRTIEGKEIGQQYVDNRQQIVSTADSVCYNFRGIKSGEGLFHGKEFHYLIQFQDIPGGWFHDPEGRHDKETSELIESSDAYMYCIDTPAMMTGGSFHYDFNCTSTVKSWLDKAAQNGLLKGKSIIFVLSRSERWQLEEEKVIEQFKENYASLIACLKNAKASIYVTPVYTLGGVTFTTYNEDRMPVYEKIGPRKQHKCSIPLIQLLHDGMDTYEKKLHELNKRWDIKTTNKLGITHFDLAEECAKELKQLLKKFCDKSIVIHKPLS